MRHSLHITLAPSCLLTAHSHAKRLNWLLSTRELLRRHARGDEPDVGDSKQSP